MSPQNFISMKIRLRHAGGYAMGPGKADLLDAIREAKSIAAAGRNLGISYSKTRHLLEEMNRDFQGPLVVTTKGGADGGGSRLTDLGARVLGRFRAMEDRAREAIEPLAEEMAALLGDPRSSSTPRQ